MYEVINIIQHKTTREVILKNLITGKVEKCFDNSMSISDKNNFEFINVGQQYKCKILLFGALPNEQTKCEIVTCEITGAEIAVDGQHCVEVKVSNDVYYVLKGEVEEYLEKGSFKYGVSRKDLIQVDDVEHPYLQRYCYDTSILYLVRNEKHKKDGYILLDLYAGDPDDSSFADEVHKIACSIAEHFSKNCVVLHNMLYKKTFEPEGIIEKLRNKFFNYERTEMCEKEMQNLINNVTSQNATKGTISQIKIEQQSRWEKWDANLYCVLQEKLDMDFFKKSQRVNGTGFMAIFAHSKIDHSGSDIETIEKYWKKQDDIMSIMLDCYLPWIHISLNTNMMSVEQFAEELMPIIKAHGKTLEVDMS